MYQCLGLGTVEEGGCGEDWWHTGCIMGLGPDWEVNEKELDPQKEAEIGGEVKNAEDAVPPGFPEEDDFDVFICYKCVDSNPWIKKYAGSKAAVPPVFNQPKPEVHPAEASESTDPAHINKKRKAEDDLALDTESPKKHKAADSHNEDTTSSTLHPNNTITVPQPAHSTLPPAPKGTFSLFLRVNFREHLCRCAECFPALAAHPQLLEEEDSYEPPRSESDEGEDSSSVGTRSLLDRGEKALNNVDRVRAIGELEHFLLEDSSNLYTYSSTDLSLCCGRGRHGL
jgi:E3 ubiquitin-protein ligase UBR7